MLATKKQKALTVAFTGHRLLKNTKLAWLQSKLDETIQSLIEKGMYHFMSGAATGYDSIAANAVLKAREYNANVRLILAIPCTDQDSRWRESDKQVYRNLLDNADEIIYVSGQPYFDGCMEQRNRYLVEHSSILVAYLTHNRSGTSQTVRLARENGLTIINLAESQEGGEKNGEV